MLTTAIVMYVRDHFDIYFLSVFHVLGLQHLQEILAAEGPRSAGSCRKCGGQSSHPEVTGEGQTKR